MSETTGKLHAVSEQSEHEAQTPAVAPAPKLPAAHDALIIIVPWERVKDAIAWVLTFVLLAALVFVLAPEE